MRYRTCEGCVRGGVFCSARDALRIQLSGLRITSVRWQCRERIACFQIGDPVWALTVDGQPDGDEDGDPFRGRFPAIVIREAGTKMLVFIEPGARDADGDLEFSASHNGFCKIPLSRLSARDGERESVCPACEWPASKGHMQGYSCAYEEQLRLKRAANA